MERVKGIEPSYSAWKAAALPLSYTRDFSPASFPNSLFSGSATRGAYKTPRSAEASHMRQETGADLSIVFLSERSTRGIRGLGIAFQATATTTAFAVVLT
jgi:hypothetical protein